LLKTIYKYVRSNKKYKTIAIITKTNKQAVAIYEKLKKHIPELALIGDNKEVLSNGVNVISAFNSKGLEFDYVIVPQVNPKNYSREYDINLLFIACSRAMHKLDLITDFEFCDKIQNYINKK